MGNVAKENGELFVAFFAEKASPITHQANGGAWLDT